MPSIMTLNILTAKATEPHPWAARQSLVLNLIRAQTPDILCLQEALEPQKQYLKDHLPDYEVYGIGRNDGGTEGEQTAIFHKPQAFTALERGVFWLSQTPHAAGSIGWDAKRPRIVTYQKLRTRDGNTFYVLNTHYDHKGMLANIKSAEVIQSQTKHFDPLCPILLCGDFNSTPSSMPYQTLLDIGYQDARALARTTLGPSFTYHKFKMCEYASPSASVALMQAHARIFQPIDHIFVNGSIFITSFATLDDCPAGLYPSDHFALFCLFDFPATPVHGLHSGTLSKA